MPHLPVVVRGHRHRALQSSAVILEIPSGRTVAHGLCMQRMKSFCIALALAFTDMQWYLVLRSCGPVVVLRGSERYGSHPHLRPHVGRCRKRSSRTSPTSRYGPSYKSCRAGGRCSRR